MRFYYIFLQFILILLFHFIRLEIADQIKNHEDEEEEDEIYTEREIKVMDTLFFNIFF